MQTNMLVGVAPELIGNTADEIVAISTGKDHFIVQGVLRSGDALIWPRALQSHLAQRTICNSPEQVRC